MSSITNYDLFAPELDDGEGWLPSDMFINEVMLSKYSNFSRNMDDLAHHLAALSLLRNRPTYRPTLQKPAPTPQFLEPAVRDVSVNHLPSAGYRYLGFNGVESGQRLEDYGTRPLLTRSGPFYEFQLQQQVDGYLETRGRVLQKQQNSFRNRAYPFQRSGSCGLGFGAGGGLKRESGGTGVFHPRIVNPITTVDDGVKKEGVKSRQQFPVAQQQRNAMNRICARKPEDYCYHCSSEMGLPQDWTY